MSLLARRLARLSVALCLALLCIALSSCKKDGLLPNEQQGKTDLPAFIFTEMAKYGGSIVPPARVTAIGLTKYVYSEDKDGFQIVCLGNQVAALCGVFQPQFGNPALSTTNASGLASFVYSVNQTGLAINCGLDSGIIDGVKQQVTQLVAVKQGALR